ncbi:MAG: TIGR01177 family methyltransferase, partial [Candidatus Altiarchaeales archaeon]
MKVMFIFSGEHPELPKAELEAVLEGESISYKKILENKAQRILV